MISVTDALNEVFTLCAPVGTETVALRHAAGRVLAVPATARRDQPPFASSAMDATPCATRMRAKGPRSPSLAKPPPDMPLTAPSGRVRPYAFSPARLCPPIPTA